MRYIIVDGYNVIRADPRLQSLERVSLEHARDVLVRTLASAPRLAQDRITVVFDGTRGTRSHLHRQQRGRIELVYSARGQLADEVIVAQAEALANCGRVVVVTDDVAVREQCRAAGCEVSGAGNLLDQVPGRPRPGPQNEEERDPWSGDTVKRGNPRRTGKRERRRQEIRF